WSNDYFNFNINRKQYEMYDVKENEEFEYEIERQEKLKQAKLEKIRQEKLNISNRKKCSYRITYKNKYKTTIISTNLSEHLNNDSGFLTKVVNIKTRKNKKYYFIAIVKLFDHLYNNELSKKKYYIEFKWTNENDKNLLDYPRDIDTAHLPY